jgi:hypothetical protein
MFVVVLSSLVVACLFNLALFVWRRAAVYTFWYHPCENTWGHVLGFVHTSLIMLQGSLMFTPVHLNRLWRFVVETWVLVHAGVVAYQSTCHGLVVCFV